jgi:hypothetical protein
VEKLSLLNKFVKTIGNGRDVTDILSFMYPGFILRDEIFYDNNNDVIYIGKSYPSLRKDLDLGTRKYIAVVNTGVSDIDLTDRGVSTTLLYNKWGKSPSSDMIDLLDTLSEPDYWNYFKEYWIIGKSNIENANISIFNLYSLLGKQRHEILKMYFQLLDFYSDNSIFSGILSFLEKSMNLDSVSTNSGRYLKLLQDFNREYSDKIIPIIQRVYTMDCRKKEDKQYRTIWLLMQLGKGEMV